MTRSYNLRPLIDHLSPEIRQRFDAERLSAQSFGRTLSGDRPVPKPSQDDLDILAMLSALTEATGSRLPNETILSAHQMQTAFEQARLEEELQTQRRRIRAKELLAAEQAADIDVPSPSDLGNFILEYADQDESWLIERLWPQNGRILLAAPPKAGKTTLMANIIRVLADGDPFLEEFGVDEPGGGVLLIDTEMSSNKLAQWLDVQGIEHQDEIRVISLRGQLSTFNILDPDTRTRLARTFEGSRVVILDNLRPVLDALGLDENREAGRFLTAWDEFVREMGSRESLIVTHTGHGRERARGDSALLASNDAMWNINRKDDNDLGGPRYFKAYGRDVDQPEVRLEREVTTGRLTIGGGSRKADKTHDAAHDVLAALQGAHEAPTKSSLETQLMDSHGHARKAVRDAMHHAISNNWISPRRGQRNATLLDLLPAGVAELQSQSANSPQLAVNSPAR